MPAHFMRETGVKMERPSHIFSMAHSVYKYTRTQDYIDILTISPDRNVADRIDGSINEKVEKARDYLMALPTRLCRRVADRNPGS